MSVSSPMSSSVSPLAPASFPSLPPIAGLQIGTLAAGLRYQQRADLMVAFVPVGATAAAVFTQSLCPSAPVDWCRQMLASEAGPGEVRAIVCNAGNANAFTGQAGWISAEVTANAIARALDVAARQVLLASTGVIGETLDDDQMAAAMPKLAAARVPAEGAVWEEAARAVSTTDTFAKGAGHQGNGWAVTGFAKGSGMIAPDMATMLGFVFTDLAATAEVLHQCLSESVPGSYNAITVDSDTSTSDTVFLVSTGMVDADNPITSTADPRYAALAEAVTAVNLDLAHQIVRDGEGASKFIEITVTGAESDASAAVIGRSIANSPLVKTAIGAADANWGRVVMAVGKAGQPALRDALEIWMGPEQVTEGGWVRDGYSEERATEHLQQDDVQIKIDVGVGTGTATIWTCDLTHRYIDINASYRS